MPIHGYAGGVISATPVVPTSTSASGVWTTELQAQALAAGNWPNASSQIARSLRFNSADSAYLNRTPGSAGNRKTWTWSGWLKRSSLGSSQYFMSAYTASTDAGFFGCRFTNFDVVSITGGTTEWLGTTQVFRDVSGWYHFVIAVDTTQATANNRVRFYVNGSEVTVFSNRNNPTLDDVLGYNGNWSHTISSNTLTPNQFFNGYLADVYFIDGSALTPSSFGYFDSNGIWQPNSYTGSYGTNGFWLNFDDNSGTTSTTLGKDSSGNGNNWTPNNFSVTAGAGNDSLVDSPTNYGTDTGVGGEVRGNYATMNPLANNGGTLANGNLDHTGTTAITTSTLFPTSGKWYCELTCTAYGGGGSFGYTAVGVIQSSQSINTIPNSIANVPVGLWIYRNDGIKANNGASASYGSTWTANDVIGIAIDIDAGKVWFAKNNTWQSSGDPAVGTNAAYTNLSGAIGIAINDQGSYSSSYSCNFGQRPFAYTAPAGFKALCSTNLPTPTIQKGASYFNPVLYTGTGSTQSVTGVGFQPDWVWIKKRSGAESHALSDVLRGTNNILISNSTAADNTASGTLTAFGADGFTVGAQGIVNDNTFTFVAWNWKANGTGVSNTAGSITSTVSANQTAGFSIVTYTGTGANATVGHGLGAAPSMVIVKKRSSATSSGWAVYHISTGATKYLQLQDVDAANTVSTMWNNTAPTSSVFSIGTDAWLNASTQTMVAYCFAPVAGYSEFGSYTGNGSADGPFIYTGFRPAYVLIKCSNLGNSTRPWVIKDKLRAAEYNPQTGNLYTNLSNAEDTDSSVYVDLLSNGFKIRGTYGGVNASSDSYIYACFAENPFKIARAR